MTSAQPDRTKMPDALHSAQETPRPTGTDEAPSPELLAWQLGAELVKLEGTVSIRFSGNVKAGELQIPYALVPSRGMLARPAKWRKLASEAQCALVRERANPEAMEELRRSVENFA